MIVRLIAAVDLPIEAMAAFAVWWIVVAAKAISAPVTHHARQTRQTAAVGVDGAAFTQRDMMRRIKAQRAQMSEGAAHLAVIGAAQRIAGIFDYEQIVPLRKLDHLIHLDRIAQRVWHEH